MKYGKLSLVVLLICLCLVTNAEGQTEQTLKLDAPAQWRTESVKLPPPFAPKVSLKGKAQVYFSPGWGKPKSDQFFTYAFVFQTEVEPKFDKKLIEKELLAYFGGLASRISRGKVDLTTFKLSVKEVKQASGGSLASNPKQFAASNQRFAAELKWTEPFFTKAEQTLNMEMVSQYRETDKKNYLMVCVSPQDPKSKSESSVKVWEQLRKIQTGFAKNKMQTKAVEKTTQ